MSPCTYHAWRMVPAEDGPQPFRFEHFEAALPVLGPDEALVEIAGCGVCGTDLAYFHGEVPTVAAPPLTLGHEASGRVVRGGRLEGEAVIVPTILPCRKCELCLSGRANRCLRQKMFGGNHGPWGCFASHVVVPARELSVIPRDCPLPLERMAVVADAVSTPYQAVRRTGLGPGSKVVVIGASGGLGLYLVQWARLLGAQVVIGMARGAARLQPLSSWLDAAVATDRRPAETIRHDMWQACKAAGSDPRCSWTIFEASGTMAGQELALALLTSASKLVLVGYAPGTVTHTLSKLMALDAEIVGSWGCDPRLYAEVVAHVVRHDIEILPFTETRPMSQIADTFAELKGTRRGSRRIVLTVGPDENGVHHDH